MRRYDKASASRVDGRQRPDELVRGSEGEEVRIVFDPWRALSPVYHSARFIERVAFALLRLSAWMIWNDGSWYRPTRADLTDFLRAKHGAPPLDDPDEPDAIPWPTLGTANTTITNDDIKYRVWYA